jgi:hypothetical protein
LELDSSSSSDSQDQSSCWSNSHPTLISQEGFQESFLSNMLLSLEIRFGVGEQ